MDWLNKEKIVFLVSLLLIIYALVSVFGVRTAPIDNRGIRAPLEPDKRRDIQWGTEKTLLSGYFGDLWSGGRDPFLEKEITELENKETRHLANPPFLKTGKLKPVPTFIGAPPRVREVSKTSPGGGGGTNE